MQLVALAVVALVLAASPRRLTAPVDMTLFTWDASVDCWATRRHVPALGADVTVEVYPESPGAAVSPRQAAVIAALDHLPPDFRDRLDDAAEVNREEFDELVDLKSCGLGHINRTNIREHYSLPSLIIPPLNRVRGDYFFLAGNCDWEEEHGIEMIVKDGGVVRCTANDCAYMASDWGDAVERGWVRKLMRRLRP